VVSIVYGDRLFIFFCFIWIFIVDTRGNAVSRFGDGIVFCGHGCGQIRIELTRSNQFVGCSVFAVSTHYYDGEQGCCLP
jgi:hypothetical protein